MSKRAMNAIVAGGLLCTLGLMVIPGLLQSPRASYERGAAACLRTFVSAQADFRANDRDGNGLQDYWTADVRGLYYQSSKGAPIALIHATMAHADGAPLEAQAQAVPWAGYLFVAMRTDERGEAYNRGAGRHPTQFAFCAYPIDRSSGRYTFIVNERNLIYKKEISGQPVLKWPADPAAEGWAPLD